MIDDDELSREVLSLLLDDDGFTVTTAGSGGEALGLLGDGEAAPEVVLADLQMPGLAGNELAGRLREACGDVTRVIAMSGSRPAGDAVAGFDAFVLKPFSMAELHELLQRMEREAVGAEILGEQVMPDTDEVLDGRIFEGFAGMMGSGSLREFYGMCLADAEKQLVAMRADAESGDDVEFRKSAHAMKGSLGMVGARELQRMCAEMEEHGMGDNHVATLREFGAAIERLRRMLRARGVQLPTDDPARTEE